MNYSDKEILDKFFPIEEEKIGISMIWEDILKDLKPYPSIYNPDIIDWKKNGYMYFCQNKKFKILWCDEKLVWSVFENKENPDYLETKEIISNLLLSHDEWKDYELGWNVLY